MSTMFDSNSDVGGAVLILCTNGEGNQYTVVQIDHSSTIAISQLRGHGEPQTISSGVSQAQALTDAVSAFTALGDS